MSGYVTLANNLFDGIKKFCRWNRKRGKRNNVQSMRKAVRDRDIKSINIRLSKLKSKAQNKRDSE